MRKWIDTYFDALRKGQQEATARRIAQISKKEVEQERLNNPLFADIEDAIFNEVTDTLEDEAIRRARDGVEKPIFYKGEQVASMREYSDSLMAFLLKGRRRDRYGDKSEVRQENALQISLRDVAAEAGVTTAEEAVTAINALGGNLNPEHVEMVLQDGDPASLVAEAGRRIAANNQNSNIPEEFGTFEVTVKPIPNAFGERHD